MKIRVEGENVTVNSMQDPQVRVKTPHIRDQTDYFGESASRLAMSRASIKSAKLTNTLKSGGYLLSDFASENMEGVSEARDALLIANTASKPIRTGVPKTADAINQKAVREISKKLAKDSAKKVAKETAKKTSKETVKVVAKETTKVAVSAAATTAGAVGGAEGMLIGAAAGKLQE